MRRTSIINDGIALTLVTLVVAGCGGISASVSHGVSSSGSSSSSAPSSTTPGPPFTQTTIVTTTPAPRPVPRRVAGPLAGRIIVIDPGHNGGNADAPAVIGRLVPAGRGRTKACNTTGTATDGGYPEASFNWDMALRLKRLLLHHGARVIMTRPSNTGVGPCVNERAAIGNAAHADAVIAIHADGGPASGRGFHVIYPPDSGVTAPIYQASLQLAHAIHDAILASGLLATSTYAGQNGYNERDDLAGLNLSTRPAIFVELGNMRNSTDAALQVDPGFRQRVAETLAIGLTGFLRAKNVR